jgi:hypothetical protein
MRPLGLMLVGAYIAGFLTLLSCGHSGTFEPKDRGPGCDTTVSRIGNMTTILVHCVEECDPETVAVEIPGPPDTLTVVDTVTVTLYDTVTVYIPVPVECPERDWQCVVNCMEQNGLGHWRECLETCIR